MKRAVRARKIQAILDELYPHPAIPLQHHDPYTLLIAVLLSAQCTDKRVNQVTPELFARAATPGEMVRLSVSDIETVIRPCGLAPTKAKNIYALSKRLLDEHEGHVPRDLDTLETLPGVGHKTASVVMCQAFGEAAFPVDTHIHRLATRWGLTSGRNVAQTERDLKKVFPESAWSTLHLQIIYFGREYCPARGHVLTQCPICGWAASKAQIKRERQK